MEEIKMGIIDNLTNWWEGTILGMPAPHLIGVALMSCLILSMIVSKKVRNYFIP
jgi:hypothetical protein